MVVQGRIVNMDEKYIESLSLSQLLREHQAIEIIKKYFKYNFDTFVAKPEWYDDFEDKEGLLLEVLL